jgi:hypothetical protein
MPQEPTAIEQAVSRAIRDNLERIQRTTDELNQAVNDVVAACASSKPINALPPMLRAQSTAASVAAALEVLSRFVAVTLQSGPRSPLELEMTRLATTLTTESARLGAAEALETVTEPKPSEVPLRDASFRESAVEGGRLQETATEEAPPRKTREKASPETAPVGPPAFHKADIPAAYKPKAFTPEPEPLELPKASPYPEDVEVAGESDFDVNQLSAEEQELHRRANRVAKVSMQDIKMLRPEQVRLGREKKDLCIRLRDDIEKAHREYDRRFRPIMDHPVDYFYRWMVEILADGDAHALGEYPYAIHANQR